MKIETAGSSIGLGTILFVVFLILKLTKYITWSWWWVAAPLWAPLALVLFVAIVVGLVTFVARR